MKFSATLTSEQAVAIHAALRQSGMTDLADQWSNTYQSAAEAATFWRIDDLTTLPAFVVSK